MLRVPVFSLQSAAGNVLTCVSQSPIHHRISFAVLHFYLFIYFVFFSVLFFSSSLLFFFSIRSIVCSFFAIVIGIIVRFALVAVIVVCRYNGYTKTVCMNVYYYILQLISRFDRAN